MGALATRTQVQRVRESVELLAGSQEMVYGDLDNFDITGGNKKREHFSLRFYSTTMIHIPKQTFIM